MKLIIALSCLLVLAYANEDANVLKNDAEVNVDSFKYIYELDNSIKAEQQGQLKDKETWVVHGENSYKAPEGVEVYIKYSADEYGYKVESAHPPLPTPPPIPEQILKSLEWIKAHPYKEEKY